MKRIAPLLRMALDVLPLLALAGCTIVLAWQYAQDRTSATLAQLVFVGAVIELCGAFLDALLAESLAEKLLMRVIGWIATHILFGGLVFAVVLHARELAPLTWVLVAAFVVPRFVTFVLMPPTDELARRRIKARARDRLESVFASATAIPVVVIIGLVLGSTLPIYPGVLIVLMAYGMLSGWFLLVAVSAALIASPAFEKRPQRLLTRGIGPWLVHPFPGKARDSHDEWRREEAAWRGVA